jgi:hypothetical protein
VLAIYVVDFLGDVVHSALQRAHATLKVFALASYSGNRILLRAQPRLSGRVLGPCRRHCE